MQVLGSSTIRTAAPRFKGLLFVAEMSQPVKEFNRTPRPKFTAYLGDYAPFGYDDGAVLLKTLNKKAPPIVLEAKNTTIAGIVKSLREEDGFSGHTTLTDWDAAKQVFHTIAARYDTWAEHLGEDPFETVFEGQRPQNDRLTFEELLIETSGFRYSRTSGIQEPSNRKILIDKGYKALSDGCVTLWRAVCPQRTIAQKPVEEPPVDYSTIPSKRVTIPEDIALWLKENPAHIDAVRWLMAVFRPETASSERNGVLKKEKDD